MTHFGKLKPPRTHPCIVIVPEFWIAPTGLFGMDSKLNKSFSHGLIFMKTVNKHGAQWPQKLHFGERKLSFSTWWSNVGKTMSSTTHDWECLYMFIPFIYGDDWLMVWDFVFPTFQIFLSPSVSDLGSLPIEFRENPIPVVDRKTIWLLALYITDVIWNIYVLHMNAWMRMC